MTVWIIEPHDPLIVRDGKPFDLSAGASSVSLPFPFPSTTTGGVRTQAGLNAQGVFDISTTGKTLADLKKFAVRGPLLVQLDNDTTGTLLVPAPLDALFFEVKSVDKHKTEQEPQENDKPEHKLRQVDLHQLVPLKMRNGIAYTALSYEQKPTLALVGLVHPKPDKPAKQLPLYWHWEAFERWLIDPAAECGPVTLHKQGHNGPQREQRVHVSIDATTRAAYDGRLFGTSGLEFTHIEQNRETTQASDTLRNAKRLALAVSVDEENSFADNMRDGLAAFGGERRTASWRKSTITLPICPPAIEKAIVTSSSKACRIILLTPAYFTNGYLPTWLTQPRYGVTPELRATAVQRPHVLSGWDIENRRPKPTRRLAPAGTVLFLKLNGSDEAIKQWVHELWMQCVSDDAEQEKDENRQDGFGLAAIGTWSGNFEEMKLEENA